jgi:hypothetical protein
LSVQDAKCVVSRLVKHAAEHGGCLVINWHDRSLAPERLWGACYRELIEELKQSGAWFATAGQAISWFRKRRSAGFESDADGVVRVHVAENEASLPPLCLRICNSPDSKNVATGRENRLEIAVVETANALIS